MQRTLPQPNQSVLELRTATMTYNTIDDSSLPSSSLHGTEPENDAFGDFTEPLSEVGHDSVDMKRAAFGQRKQKEISMDLEDLLADMEEERDESDSSDSTSASLALDNSEEDFINTSERMGSKLAMDDMPSQSKLEWGSVNWGSFMGSFSKRRNGNSRRLLRGLGSSKKLKLDSDEPGTTKKKRKSVRFFKFETILPSHESFRRRYSQEDSHQQHEDFNQSFSTF